MTLSIKRSRILILGLFIILIGAENCFYFVNADSINIAGVFNYQDFFVIFGFLWTVLVLFIYKGYPSPKYTYWPFIAGMFLLAIFSSYQSFELYGQSFFVGLRPQRFWLFYGILYFPISKLLYIKKLSVQNIVRMICFVGMCEVILYILQYALYGTFDFLYVKINSRYGDIRFYFYTILLRLFLFIALDAYFHGKNRIKNIVWIIGVFVVLMLVGKMRMTSLSTVCACCIGVVLWKKGGIYKFVSVIIGVFMLVFLINTELMQDTLYTAINYLSGNSLSSLEIRDEGRIWYLLKLASNPILGCGYISILNAEASVAAGFDQNIYLVDNGIWGFLFIYGALGGIWLITFFGKLLQDAWKLMKGKYVYFPLLFLLGLIISCQTELHWYWDNGFFILVLVFSMMPYFQNNEL